MSRRDEELMADKMEKMFGVSQHTGIYYILALRCDEHKKQTDSYIFDLMCF